MLRNTKQIRHAPLPAVARLLTIGVLCVLGPLVAGVRGPMRHVDVHKHSPNNRPSARRNACQRIVQPGLSSRRCQDGCRRATQALLDAPRDYARPRVDQTKSRLQAGHWPSCPRMWSSSFCSGKESEPSASQTGFPWFRSRPAASCGRQSLRTGNRFSKNQHLGPIAGGPSRRSGLFPYRTGTHPRLGCIHSPTIGRWSSPGRPAPRADRGPQSPGAAASLGRGLEQGGERSGHAGIRDALAAEATRPGNKRRPDRPGQPHMRILTLETISPLLDKAQSYALGIDLSQGLTVDLVAVTRVDDDAKPSPTRLHALLTLGTNAVQGKAAGFHGKHATAASHGLDRPGAGSLLEQAQRRDLRGASCTCRRSPRVDLPRESSSWRRPWRPQITPRAASRA